MEGSLVRSPSMPKLVDFWVKQYHWTSNPKRQHLQISDLNAPSTHFESRCTCSGFSPKSRSFAYVWFIHKTYRWNPANGIIPMPGAHGGFSPGTKQGTHPCHTHCPITNNCNGRSLQKGKLWVSYGYSYCGLDEIHFAPLGINEPMQIMVDKLHTSWCLTRILYSSTAVLRLRQGFMKGAFV